MSALRLGYLKAEDEAIFDAAREAGAIILTKDADFVRLIKTKGAPPQVVWYRGGNASTQRVREVLRAKLPEVLEFLWAGEEVVEVRD